MNELSKEALYEKMKKAVSVCADEAAVSDMVSVLRRLEHELTETALQGMNAKTAVDEFTLDLHGIVKRKE